MKVFNIYSRIISIVCHQPLIDCTLKWKVARSRKSSIRATALVIIYDRRYALGWSQEERISWPTITSNRPWATNAMCSALIWKSIKSLLPSKAIVSNPSWSYVGFPIIMMEPWTKNGNRFRRCAQLHLWKRLFVRFRAKDSLKLNRRTSCRRSRAFLFFLLGVRVFSPTNTERSSF